MLSEPKIANCNSSQFFQYEYPLQLYQSEIEQHNQLLAEYDSEIYDLFANLIDINKPNLELYKQQPYLTFSIRLKLIDFLLKMSIRLKILPFVFFKAVKIFDRYCSKRIVLLDQSQLIITTCLWVASKIQGGNNHFVNLHNRDKIDSIKTISDLGYGSGGKYLGPTERFRLPKLHELVKLCGERCKYDSGMFKQMELHVLQTLDWSLSDPSIEEFIIQSHEFNILKTDEFFKVKEYLSYISLYSHELIDVNLIELSQVILDLINEVFNLNENGHNYLCLDKPIKFDLQKYKFIKKYLIKSVLYSSEFMLKLFDSQGPQFLYYQINIYYSNSYSITPRKRNISISSTSTSPSQQIIKKSPMNKMKFPPPHQLPSNYNNYAHPSPSKNIYKSVSYNSPSSSIYTLPNIITDYQHSNNQHQHNNSQASLNSSSSREQDIFESNSIKHGIATPLSDSESPVCLKSFENN